MANDSRACKYCGHYSVLTDYTFKRSDVGQLECADGNTRIWIYQFVCQNSECRKTDLFAVRVAIKYVNNEAKLDGELQKWRLLPASTAKPQPDYIPSPILQDYQEACAILSLSPKASATLSRRCLQGMVRHFFGATGPTLKAELDSVKDKMDPRTWDAIQVFREIGNVGAHMEKDVNVIVDVDPDEASLLIELTEQLFEDWYVDREEKTSRLKKAKELAEQKKAEREAVKAKGGSAPSKSG
jgi:hypothetical protein